MSHLAHDLQQPLGIITMMLDLLFKKNQIKLSPEQQKYVQYIFDAADEACKIIRDFAQKKPAGNIEEKFRPLHPSH